MTKHIVLCADDYGQSLPISQGIIKLISAQRLSAVSCLVNFPESEAHGKWLKTYQDQVDIGLHFNLTEGSPLSNAYKKKYGEQFLSLPTLMRMAYTRRLALPVLVAECNAQLQRFVDVYSRPPDFMDGHQHVHQFPIIQNAVTEVFNIHMPKQAYMRLAKPAWCFKHIKVLLKQIALFALGSSAFHERLRQQGILHNASFSGMYHFAGAYEQWFKYFLRTINTQGLIMCHPSLDGFATKDGIAKARYQEYLYLISDGFISDCRDHDVKINRFRRIINPS